MKTRTLQTRNILESVLIEAENKAVNDGLSSVQDVVRILLSKYAKGDLKIGVVNEISPSKEISLLRDAEDIVKEYKAKKLKAYDNQ